MGKTKTKLEVNPNVYVAWVNIRDRGFSKVRSDPFVSKIKDIEFRSDWDWEKQKYIKEKTYKTIFVTVKTKEGRTATLKFRCLKENNKFYIYLEDLLRYTPQYRQLGAKALRIKDMLDNETISSPNEE